MNSPTQEDYDRLSAEHQAACDELHRLRDGLLLTRDGKPIVLGMVIEVEPTLNGLLPNRSLVVTGFSTPSSGPRVEVLGAWGLDPLECYSSIGALRLAMERKKGGNQ